MKQCIQGLQFANVVAEYFPHLINTSSYDNGVSGDSSTEAAPLSVTGPGLHWHRVGGRIWPGLCKHQDVNMFPASGNNVLSYYFMHRGMETFFLCFSLPPSSFRSMIQTPLTVWS